MLNSKSMLSYLQLQILLLVLVTLYQAQESDGQQSYLNNKQNNCENNEPTTLGFVCNGVRPSCASYLTFRSDSTYNSTVSIGRLLNAQPSQIALINNVSEAATLPIGTILIVPINCSCLHTPPTRPNYYQHNSSYVLTRGETYFSVANVTYGGLTTCQTLIAQNPYNYRELEPGMNVTVPLRCACPTPNQTAAGVKYLVSYLVAFYDDIETIGEMFGGVDPQSIWDANELRAGQIIYPFTPILVPLKSEPTQITLPPSRPPPPPQQLPAVPGGNGDSDSSSHKWVFVGVGVGVGLLLFVSMSGLVVWFFRRRQLLKQKQSSSGLPSKQAESFDHTALPGKDSWSVSVEGVRYAVESLTVYKFEDIQKATDNFGEANRIKGSVYRGSFKGDNAAVKMLKGDVSGEINMLIKLNHTNIIRLSGFCIHEGNTYLIYEYAEKGSLSDWLHYHKKENSISTLSWKQRVRIAYDVADALNYLHNYADPPYIHKNLKSSNVLLDGDLRAKISNFGLARTLETQDEGGLQLTRHVVGTYGYLAPEYIENGVITPKLDVFAFGVVMLELLSGREATRGRGHGHGGDSEGENNNEEEELLSVTINQVLEGHNVREKLQNFIDPCLTRNDYPPDVAFSMAELARNCVAHDLNSRPMISEVSVTLSKILSTSMDWDPSAELEHSRSRGSGR